MKKSASGNKEKISPVQAMVESAILIAIATVLSLIKLVDLPYGGSVTIASMLPILIIAYRHGLGLGLASGFVFGMLQQLLGLKTLSYVTGWQSVLAVVLLDYIFAFMMIGFGGVFRKVFVKQAPALTLGALLASVLRYACHVISGATVWAGLSIPTKDALIYSFAYNATYMVPEAIVLIVSAYDVGNTLDFRAQQPVRLRREMQSTETLPRLFAGLLISAALIFDAAAIFGKLQNAETGEWNMAGLSEVNWLLVGLITGAAVVIGVALIVVSHVLHKKKTNAPA